MEENNKKQERISLDDLFESLADDGPSAADIIKDVSYDLEIWFEENEKSYKNFHNNIITDLTGRDGFVNLLYKINPELDDEQITTINLCVASIKSMGFVIGDIRPEDDDSPECNSNRILRLYGHILDYDDNFGSRFDEKLLYTLPNPIESKFDYVELSGCFPSVEEMRDMIMTLYKKLTKQSYISKILLHLDSTVKDDDGKWRTIADLIHSGYIEPTVVRIPNVVEYVYKKLDNLYTEKLYNIEYKEEVSEKLF